MIFLSYIEWEVDQRGKSTRGSNKGSGTDPLLIRAIHERAIAAYARAAVSADAAAEAATESILAQQNRESQTDKARGPDRGVALAELHEQRRITMETVRMYKDAEAIVWAKYTAYLVSDIKMRS